MKILAVDLSNLFRANWEATAGKELDGAFERTIAAIVRARDGFDRVAICCDSGPSFRKAIDPGYKAHRPPTPAAYGEQLRRTVERLAADGCAIFRAPCVDTRPNVNGDAVVDLYAEADDLIGALCLWADTATHPDGTYVVDYLLILGSDKDLLACVNEPGAPGSLRLKIDVQRLTGEVFDAAAVESKIGLPPHKVPEWLALAGDGSDGFKPFPGEMVTDEKTGKTRRGPGIGDKTAVQLLKTFGTVAGIFDAIDDERIGAHHREILKRHGINAGLRGLALASLRTDIAVDFSPLLAEPKVEKIAERGEYFGERAPVPGGHAIARAVVPGEAPQSKDAKPEPPEVRGEPVEPRTSAPVAPSAAMVRVEVSPIDPYALQPRDLSDVELVGEMVMNSRAYGFATKEQVMLAVMDARERGIPAGVALRSAYSVNGRLAWSAAYLAGLVLASGRAEVFEIVETTKTHAVVAYKRKGRPEGRFEYTIEEAKESGLVRGGSHWAVRPRTMLRWAALREAARAFFPDVVGGMYTPDELGGSVSPEDLEGAA